MVKIPRSVSNVEEYFSQNPQHCKQIMGILFSVSQVLTYGVHPAMESDARQTLAPNPHVTNQGPSIGPWIVHFC
jgi:hypothetical protein